MKLSIALLVTTLAAAEASGASKWANLRRRLSFDKVAGYKPGSQVRPDRFLCLPCSTHSIQPLI